MNGKLENVFFKSHKTQKGFLSVVFNTSEGMFELDNCTLQKIDLLPEGYEIYNKAYYNPEYLQHVNIVNVLFNEEMDFIVVLDNNKVIIIGPDSNFDADFSQLIEVFDLKNLSKEYLESAEDYQ